MVEKTLKSGRKVKIKEISIDRMDELKDIPEVLFYEADGSKSVKNINKARTAWLREGLGGGDFENWKPNGGLAPDDVLKQLTNEEQLDLYKIIQISQSINPKKPSSSS